MPAFSYKAIDRTGAVVKGVIEGMDMDIAYASVASSGLYIISIKKTSEYLNAVQKRFSAFRVKRKDIIEFANNLSVMLKAGMPILTALSDISETIENVFFKQKIKGIAKMVEMGARFSGAVAEYRAVFPDIFVRLVIIGEETGSLDRSLADIATHLQRMEDLASAIKRALMYPAFAIVTTLGALFFWLLYVLPKVMDVFKDMGITLPLPTRMLVAMSGFARSYWYFLPGIPVALLIALRVLKQNTRTRYYIDMLKLKFPIMKLIVYNKLLALFSEQLRILTVAGITIDRSFRIVADVIGNDVFRVAIEDSMQSIAAGSRISDALRRHKIFPVILTRMIQIGETSGTLDEQFSYLSEYYLKRLNDISEKLGKMIEPIVIVVIGILFAFIIMGLLLPVYDLVTKMGR